MKRARVVVPSAPRMDVVALSPVLVDRVVWRRDRERWALTVVVKATFDLAPGEVRLSGHPVPVSKVDVHEGANAARSLVAPSDLVPFKARADVMLVGHAYAPHGRPVSTLTARLAVAGVDKSIAVFGNRIVSPRGVGPALPFAKMLLSYDRASGGPGTSNPAGMPRGERLPNLEPIGWSAGMRVDKASGSASAAHRGEIPPPIAFGPIAPTWPERAAKLHAWRLEDPMPEELDASYFNAAPSDQQVGFLRGDETLVLEHLHPDHATLSTRLAGVVPRAFAERRRGAPEPVEMHADTLWIDTDRRKLSIVWRGDTGLSTPDEPGRVLVAMTNAREPLGWEQMQQLYRALSTGPHDAASIDADDEESGDEEAEDEMRSTNAVPAARLPGGRLHPDFPGLPAFDDEDSEDDFHSRIDPIGNDTRAFPVPGGAVIPDAAPAWLATPSRQGGSLPQRRGTMTSRADLPPKEPMALPPNADLVWDSPAESADPRTLPPPIGFGPMNEAAAAPPVFGLEAAAHAPFPSLHETAAGPVFAHEAAPPMPFGQPHEIQSGRPASTIPPPPMPPNLGQMGSQIGPPNLGQMGSQIGPPNLGQMGSQIGPALGQIEENRTGPLPAIQPSSLEPASPWASGIEPVATAAPAGPMVPLAQPSAVMLRPDPAELPPPPRPPRRAPPRAPSEAVDLVWFEGASVARIAARYRELVDDLDMEPLDPAHDLPVDDPAAARDRHHVFGVLTRATLTDPHRVSAAVRAATDAHGRFTAPLVIVEGDLVLGLDDRSVLKTTAACAKPLAKDNKRLQEVLASVDEVMETPLLLGAAGASEGLLRELLSAVSQSKRALPVKALEEHVERVLLGQRAYQIRTVLGGPQIRAALVPGRDAPALVSYLPEAVAPKLPLSLRFRARLIAEVHPSPDPQESSPLALRVVALGRLVALSGRGA